VTSDADLVGAALEGDQEACRQLVARHREAVHRLVRLHVNDADAALDLTQEAFVAAFLALRRYDPQRPLRAWIARIALNKCRDWHRRRVVRGFFFRARPIDEAVGLADSAPGPESEAAARAELARVRRAIDRLPDGLRSVLLLRAVEEMPQHRSPSFSTSAKRPSRRAFSRAAEIAADGEG
jgi:RNA polymerase sigma-70 factor (ECF subfamily)